MKRKITIILSLLSVFVLLFSLAACRSKKDDKTINNLSGDCGFTAEGEFAEGSTLVVESLRGVTDEQKAIIAAKDICVDNNLQVYDISVKKDNAKVQPNGKVKITLDFDGNSPNGYTVFHFKSDTEMEVLPATVANGKLSFETTSFSIFIVGENKPEGYNYNISYNLDGGSFAEGVTAPTKYGSDSKFPIALPTPEKSGYTFKGWKNAYGVEITEITDKIRGDVTLTAQWEKNEEKEFFLFRLEMDKVDQNDSNIKIVEFYSSGVSDGKGEILKTKIDGSFENNDGEGLSVSVGGGVYINILSDTVYKNCVAGTHAQERGNHGFCYYDGSFSGKISINEDYMLFVLKKIDGDEYGEDRLEAVTTDNFQTLSEGRYFVVRKDVYNAAVADGKKNETGELYRSLSDLSEPHDDGKDNVVIEDITACYEIWIQFADSVKSKK